jgi:hypothetical protein
MAEFFINYARANNDPYLRQFVADLVEVVRDLRGLTKNDEVGFFDQQDIELGADWDTTIVAALRTVNTLVSIASPAFFKSEYCSRERALFRRRFAAAQPPLIKPVMWIPFNAVHLPATFQASQFTVGDPDAVQNTKGVKYMMQQIQKYKVEYTAFVADFGADLIAAADQNPLLPLASAPALATVPPEWGSIASARPVIATATGPKHVRFVYLALDPASVGPARLKEPYQDVGGVDWKPFYPDPTPIHLFAQNLLEGTFVRGLPVVVQPKGSGGGASMVVAQFNGQLADTFRPDDFLTLVPLPQATSAVHFSTTGEWCVAVTTSSLDVWQLPGGGFRRQISVALSPRSAAFSSNGSYLAFLTDNGAFTVSTSDRNVQVRAPIPPTEGFQRPSAPRQASDSGTIPPAATDAPMAISPSGQMLAFGYGNGSALVMPVSSANIRLSTPQEAASLVDPSDRNWLRGHRGQIVDVDFSVDGSLIATSGADSTSRLWRNPIGRPAPVRPPSSSSWGDLWKTLRDRTTACLSADERMKLLNEPEAGAREAAGKCDAEYGGKVFARPTQAS